jgi:hypothetical protein
MYFVVAPHSHAALVLCAALQIVPINSRPGWLLALVGVLAAVGPVTLAAFFTWEKVIKKE